MPTEKMAVGIRTVRMLTKLNNRVKKQSLMCSLGSPLPTFDRPGGENRRMEQGGIGKWCWNVVTLTSNLKSVWPEEI